MRYGGIEAGGTKWVCAVADRPAELLKTEAFPTTGPGETVRRAVRFFTENGPVGALGVGAFGPVDIRPASPTWGTITTTPKPGWADTDLVAPLRAVLGEEPDGPGQGLPRSRRREGLGLEQLRWAVGDRADPLGAPCLDASIPHRPTSPRGSSDHLPTR